MLKLCEKFTFLSIFLFGLMQKRKQLMRTDKNQQRIKYS